jgi:hypothetical protein
MQASLTDLSSRRSTRLSGFTTVDSHLSLDTACAKRSATRALQGEAKQGEHCKEKPSKAERKEPRTQNVCRLRQGLKFLHCISGGVTQITSQPLDQFEAYTNVRC